MTTALRPARNGATPLILAILAAFTALLGLSACSSRQLYSTGQAWQMQECNKIDDFEARQRCMREAQRSYDDYQRRREELKPQP